MLKKILENKKHNPWVMFEELCFTGKEVELTTLFKQLSPTTIKVLLNSLDGNFALIKESKDYVIAAVDKLRSMPLFYYFDGFDLILSDNANKIWEKIGRDLSEEAVEVFTSSGFCVGDETLHPDIKQLVAGTYLFYDKSTNVLEIKEYFRFSRKSEVIKPKNLIKKITELHQVVFEKLISSYRNNTIIVPLSGGYDSRLIVRSINQLGFRNVICFSYGPKGNREAKIAEKVANEYNYPWVYIEYTEEKWKQVISSDDYREYSNFAGNLCSLPHLQDFLAVKELKERKLLPDNSVFVPGHSYDFLVGNHTRNEYMNNTAFNSYDVKKNLCERHFSLSVKPIKEYLKFNLNIQSVSKHLTAEEISSIDDYWNWRERQSKFIVNSVRVYEYFGYEWSLPLWDSKLMDFWSTVNLEDRFRRNLFKRYFHNNENKNVNIFTNKNNSILTACYSKISNLRESYVLKYLKNIIFIILNYKASSYSSYGVVSRRNMILGALFQGKRSVNSFLVKKYIKDILNK